MKYLKSFKESNDIQAELNRQAPLLKLENNADGDLINTIKSLMGTGSILEISCGNGADSDELSKSGYSVIATENNQQYVDNANQKINCIKHDTKNKFPFSDKYKRVKSCLIKKHGKI